MKIQEDISSLCNRTTSCTRVTNLIQNNFCIVLNLPPEITIEYKAHYNDSMVVPGGRFNTLWKVSRIRFVTPVSFAVRFHKDKISS